MSIINKSKNLVQLKSVTGDIIFEHKQKNNSVCETLKKYISIQRNSNFKYFKYYSYNYKDLLKFNKKYKIVDLSYIDLSYFDLNYIDLSYVDLTYANLRYTNLSHANLSHSNLNYAQLYYADLSYARLNFANLYRTYMQYCNLSNANLSDAIFNSTREIKYAVCNFNEHGECGRQLLCVKINDEKRFFCGCFNGNADELHLYIEKGPENLKASRFLAMETVIKLIENNIT